MKNVVIWVLLVVLVGLTACSPKLPEIAPNMTPVIPNSIPPQPADTPNTSPAFNFTRSAGPSSTQNVTDPRPHPNPITITPPGGPGLPGSTSTKEPQKGFFVDVQVIPSSETYAPGQTINVEVKLTNHSTEPVFVTLPMKADFVIPDGPDSGTVLHSFPAGSQEEKLAVNEIISYNLTWDQTWGNGTLVGPGWIFVDYRLRVKADSMPGGGFNPGGRNKLFLIQSPQNALVKTIDLNQSINVTSMNLVFSLKQVEMTEKGVSFFVVATSPGNLAPNYQDMESAILPAFAQYIVDGSVKDARASNTISTAAGIELRWGGNDNYLDPVPAGTKELTFRITSLGSTKGPWEFKIPLQ